MISIIYYAKIALFLVTDNSDISLFKKLFSIPIRKIFNFTP